MSPGSFSQVFATTCMFEFQLFNVYWFSQNVSLQLWFLIVLYKIVSRSNFSFQITIPIKNHFLCNFSICNSKYFSVNFSITIHCWYRKIIWLSNPIICISNILNSFPWYINAATNLIRILMALFYIESIHNFNWLHAML